MFSEEGLRNPGFSWSNMHSLALAAKYSYEDKAKFEAIVTDGWDVEITAAADVGDTQGYVLESSKVAVVVYRGTESISDWLTNFNIFDTDGLLGEVHKGFFKSYDRTKSIILPRILEASAAGKSIWFSGHSLGGAIATIASIETSNEIEMAGLATFGQPRTVRRSAHDAVENAIGQLYFRFVNDDDIVPRVPKTYGHFGQLLHFDAYGEIQEQEVETLGAESDEFDDALSDAELVVLRGQIEEVRSSLDNVDGAEFELEGDFEEDLDQAVEGLIPSISDHSIDKYIAAIRRIASSQFESLSSETENITSMYFETSTQGSSVEAGPGGPDILSGGDVDGAEGIDPGVPNSGSGSPSEETGEIPVLIELAARDWEPPNGIRLNSQYQRVATAVITAEQLAELGNDPDVTHIEVSREAGVLELDESVDFINADKVQAPDLNEKGDSAIVGVIDTGIDFLHDAFMDASGQKTRILAVWDQRDDTGPSPKTIDPNAFSQDYGTVRLKSDLDDLIKKHRDDGEHIPLALRDRQRHGTHVTSIAAGRGTDTLASGMAPEAPIISVIPNMSQEAGAPRSIGYSNSHVDALSFLTEAASGSAIVEERMPIAINVSLGMNAGAHDGSTLLEAAFDSATNIGRDAGVVIVKSAGNERQHAGHAQVSAAEGGIVPIEWTSEDEFRRSDYLEAWFGELDDLAFRLVDPNGDKSEWVSFENSTKSANLGGNACSMNLVQGARDNGANRLALRITPINSQIQPGTWKLEVHGRRIGAVDQGMVDIWVERTGSRSVKFLNHDQQMTLSVPGTAETVVTVGACNSEIPWSLNESSSYGPTRIGEKKPDVCAPGFQINAALAGTDQSDDTISLSGTSMAAPHVTGALALVLSKVAKTPGERMPNARQLGAAVRRTVQGGSRGYHPGAGFGVLDAKALFDDF